MVSDKEIDLLIIIKRIIINKTKILKISLLGFFLGIIATFFIDKYYVATTTFLPSNVTPKTNSFIGFSSLAGLNLNNSSSDFISPSFYEMIISSPLFLNELSKTKVNLANVKGSVTYKDYYLKYRKKNFLESIRSALFSLSKGNGSNSEFSKISYDSIGVIDAQDRSIFNFLRNKIEIDYNESFSSVELNFKMDEKVASAEMLLNAKLILQKLITFFKIDTAKKELDYISERLVDEKKEFKRKELLLARYKDFNVMGHTSRSRIKLAALESEYNLSLELFSGLTKKYETQKLKVKSSTPTFTVISPIIIPSKKSSRYNEKNIVIGFWILGLVIGVIGIVLSFLIQDLKAKLKQI